MIMLQTKHEQKAESQSQQATSLSSIGREFGRRYSQDKTGNFRFAVVFGVVNAFLFVIIGPILFTNLSDPRAANISERLLAAALLLVPVDAVFIYFYIKSRRLLQEGTITLSSGAQYPYLIGDTLAWYNGTGQETAGFGAVAGSSQTAHLQRHFRGMSVKLPVQLPQIYLDTRQDVGRVTPFVIDPSQRIDLEGDFPDTFRMYVPEGTAIEVLSIFQPDVMQTVLEYKGDYDIEMYRDTLRVISRRRVYKRPVRQAELERVAHAILQEINVQLARWQAKQPNVLPSLVIYRYKGIRLGAYYLPFRLVIIELLLCPLFLFCVYGAIVSATGSYDDSAGVSVGILFSSLFGFAMIAVGYLLSRKSKILTQFKQEPTSIKISKTR